MSDWRDLDPATIAAWLREHPTFLAQFPDVALAIELPREHGKRRLWPLSAGRVAREES